jgi:hypothetical protein
MFYLLLGKRFISSTLFRNVSDRIYLHIKITLGYLQIVTLYISPIIRNIYSYFSSVLHPASLDFLSDFPSRETTRDISSAYLLLATRRHSISKGMMITLRGVIKKFVMSQGRGVAYLSLDTEV